MRGWQVILTTFIPGAACLHERYISYIKSEIVFWTLETQKYNFKLHLSVYSCYEGTTLYRNGISKLQWQKLNSCRVIYGMEVLFFASKELLQTSNL